MELSELHVGHTYQEFGGGIAVVESISPGLVNYLFSNGGSFSNQPAVDSTQNFLSRYSPFSESVWESNNFDFKVVNNRVQLKHRKPGADWKELEVSGDHGVEAAIDIASIVALWLNHVQAAKRY